MISPTGSAHPLSYARNLLGRATASVTESFTQQLADAVVRHVGKSGHDIQPAQRQNSGTGQVPVSPKTPTPAKAPTNEVDAYWATQPPEVQALRNIPDDGDRMTLAHQLAGKGYAIDVPIMVWGWDPLTTMMLRQGYGYTWVPSATQPNIVAGPGISFPGAPDYDPKNPPPGSIKVTTDFAKGLESTSPWYSTFNS